MKYTKLKRSNAKHYQLYQKGILELNSFGISEEKHNFLLKKNYYHNIVSSIQTDKKRVLTKAERRKIWSQCLNNERIKL